MNKPRLIAVSHFSDALCVWAYIAQIRADELKTEFGANVKLQYHFLRVFGNVDAMFDKLWNHKGGVKAYNKHVLAVAAGFEHIEIHPDIWLSNRPATSISCHVFFKALQLLEAQGEPGLIPDSTVQKSPFENFVWQTRVAFFRDVKNIADLQVLIELAEQNQLPVGKILDKINTGEAYAALDYDIQQESAYHVAGSPTLVFNQGRQILYGNVGYRVIQANIRELIHQPEHQASWC